jgi:hypothetical protein
LGFKVVLLLDVVIVCEGSEMVYGVLGNMALDVPLVSLYGMQRPPYATVL